ncbi:MAG: hypothetical protein VX726_09140 [Planctomycetota bacterium]|nr:hypothetical protein [Planctomycetota bacterium]MEE2895887.1 hypothetical protein [Planctomycetota bacterium]
MRAQLPACSLALLPSVALMASTPDALDLVWSVQPEVPLQIQEFDESTGNYLVVRGGVALLQDPTVEDISFSVGANFGLENALGPAADFQMVDGRIRNASLVTGTGYDITIGLGLELSEEITVEIQTGFQWNPVDRLSADLLYTVEQDLGGGVSDTFDFASSATGGAGSLYQVPLTANLLFDTEIAEGLRLDVGIGAGIQWSTLTSSNVTSTAYPGTFVLDPDNPGSYLTVPLVMNLDGQAIAARYQAQAGLSYELFPGGYLGGYVRIAGTTLLNQGGMTFQQSPSNLYRDGGDIRIPSLRTLTVGARFSMSF